MNGYRLLKKNSLRRQGRGFAPYAKEWLESMKLCLGTGEVAPPETLWLRTRAQADRGGILVSMCYRLPDQEDIDEAFIRRSEALQSYSQILIGTQPPKYLLHGQQGWETSNLGGFWNMSMKIS